MRKFLLPIFFFFILIGRQSFIQTASAQFDPRPTPIIYPGVAPVTIGATVPGVTVNLSGFASPNASIVLTAGGIYVRSAVADQNGVFYISQISVRVGISNFCFDVVDFKRLGESYSCLDIPPIQSNKTVSDIYLPPSIGLSRKQVNVGEDVVIFGYSMPDSIVNINVKSRQNVTLQADKNGYYEYRIKSVKAGTYLLTASGIYQNKPSLTPEKGVKLEALSITRQVGQTVTGFLQRVWEFLTTSIWGFLLLVFILLLIILILIIVILKPKFPVFIFDKFSRGKKMDHEWFLRIVKG